MKLAKLLGLLLLLPAWAEAQTLTFDSDTGTLGIQTGAGPWDAATTANWHNGTGNVVWNNGGSTIAAFGTTGGVPGIITVSGTVSVGGFKFNNLGANPSVTYTFNGGVIALATDAIIEAGENTSNGSSVFITYNSVLTGTNLTMQREAVNPATFQYLRLGAANPNLFGTFTLKATNGRGIFLLTSLSTSVSSFAKIVVENGSVFAGGGTNAVYNNPFTIAGVGAQSGAIRIDGNGTNYAGTITLAADSAIATNTSIVSGIISGNIVDSGSNFGFQRLANTQESILSLTNTSTYGGTTTLGRSSGVSGGVTILDFTNIAATENLLYNNLPTAGALTMWGGTAGNTGLTLQGKASAANKQTFGNLSINGTRNSIILSPGAAGTMRLALGTITRTTDAYVNFASPVAGAISTTSADGFLGTWATQSNLTGSGSWARITGGLVTSFNGDLDHVTTKAISELTGLATTSNLRISEASSGAIPLALTTPVTVAANTISMADQWMSREITLGTGNTLRLGATGGVQITGGSKNLTISGGTLTAGTTTANSTGQIWLSNMSTSTLKIDSVIANNGIGAVSLFVNGTGNAVLTGTNTFGGAVQVGSGSLEIQNDRGLGSTTGATTIMVGAALRLSNNITSPEALAAVGTGISNDGVIRNISGTNTLTGLTTLIGISRINSDSGTLVFAPGTATANTITASNFALTVGGAGSVRIEGRIAIGSGTITKDGTGTLTLSGDNTYTGATTITAGALRVASANALGTVAGITTINAGGALEIIGSTNLAAEPITLSSSGVNNTGGIRSISGNNVLSGTISLGATDTRIFADADTLTLNAGALASVNNASGSLRNLIFGGAGNIETLSIITRTSGALSIQKEGSGTLYLRRGVSNDTAAVISNGTMVLDFPSLAIPTNMLSSNIVTPAGLTMAGGTLQIVGKSSTTTAQAFGALITNAGQSTIEVVQNTATTVNITTTALTRTVAGGTLKFILPTSGSITTTGGTENTIIRAADTAVYATVGTSDWAATGLTTAGVRPIVGLSTITNGYTSSDATTLAGNADAVVASTVLGTSSTVTSLRFNAALTTNIALGSNTLTTGGILVGTTASAATLSGGTLRSSSPLDLIVIQNNPTSSLTISSVIANNAVGTPATGLTKAGPGTLILETATHTYTGTTRVEDGMLHIKSGTLSGLTEITLGAGSKSGILRLGDGSTVANVTIDWLRTDGTGTGNAVLGGATTPSIILLDEAFTSDFRLGTIGSGTVGATIDNNLAIRVSTPTALLQLGANNTFTGKTINYRGTIEVEKLADVGLASSLGTGSFNTDAAIIELASQTTGATGASAIAILRYTGSTNSTTNRVINVMNSDDPGDIIEVVATLENTGTGTVKFTSAFTATGSNTVGRTLRLGGTNTGENEIVSIGNVTPTNTTKLEKNGTGLWALTGTSTYTGGTTVNNGVLQLGTGGTTGMVGTGVINLSSATAILSTKRSNLITIADAITGAGSVRINNTTTGTTVLTNTANADGATTVDSGTLLTMTSATTTALGTGTVTVNSGAILGGYGKITPGANQSVIFINSTLTIGDSTLGTPVASTLSVVTTGTGTLRFESASTLLMDLISGSGSGDNTGTAAAADRLVVSGNVVIDADTKLKVSGSLTGYKEGDSWKLFDWSAITRTGTFTTIELPTIDNPAFFWDTSSLYTVGVVTVVPEPGRFSLLTLAGAAAALRRRRKSVI